MATVLVIEGDPSVYQGVDRLLSALGHRILGAHTGFDGIQQADLHAVDLVLIDIDLPDMDGKGVAAALRTRPRLKNVPIVALSGSDDPVTHSLIKAFGCNDCISKSMDTRTMPQQVVTYLERFAS